MNGGNDWEKLNLCNSIRSKLRGFLCHLDQRMNSKSFKFMIRPVISKSQDEFKIALRLIEPSDDAKIDISDIIENLQSKI